MMILIGGEGIGTFHGALLYAPLAWARSPNKDHSQSRQRFLLGLCPIEISADSYSRPLPERLDNYAFFFTVSCRPIPPLD